MSKILFIIELGGFPLKFDDLLNAGHEVEYINSMRKGIKLLQTLQPDVLVVEFQYTSQFRDRDSNLDTIMTQIISRSPNTMVIALVETEQKVHFERLQNRFSQIRDALYFPFEDVALKSSINKLISTQEF